MARTQLTITPKSVTITAVIRVVAQRLSVPVWGTGGRRFKSAQPDFFCLFLTAAAIVQRLIISAPCLFPPFPKEDADLIFPIMRKRKIRRRKMCPQNRNLTQSLCSTGLSALQTAVPSAFITCPEIDSDTAFKHKKKQPRSAAAKGGFVNLKYEKNFSYLRL